MVILLVIGSSSLAPISSSNRAITEEQGGLTLPHTGGVLSFILELVLTFFLMFFEISLKEKIGYKAFGGIAIGSFIAAAGIIGLPISDGSMNPARLLGPAIIINPNL